MEAFSRGIGDSEHTNSSNRFPMFLRGNYNQSFFKCLSASDSFFKTSQISFVNLYSSRQSISPRPDHGSSHLMKPSPRRFITSKTKDAFEPESTCPILLGYNPPYGSKPNSQRFSCALKDGSGNYRCLVSANRTLIQHFSNWPSFCFATTTATKAIRPAQVKQIFTACLFRGEACFKFSKSAGIVFHTPAYYM